MVTDVTASRKKLSYLQTCHEQLSTGINSFLWPKKTIVYIWKDLLHFMLDFVLRCLLCVRLNHVCLYYIIMYQLLYNCVPIVI